MQTYDPQDVSVVVDGTILTGFAEGTFIRGEKASDTFTKHVGALGEVDRSRNADPSGTLTITLKQTSPSNGLLNRLAKSKSTFNARVIDRNSRNLQAGGNTCWIQKAPAFDRSDAITNREWIIVVADYDQDE